MKILPSGACRRCDHQPGDNGATSNRARVSQSDDVATAKADRDDAERGPNRSPGWPARGIKAVPVRHPGRWLAAVVVLVLAAMLVHTLLTTRGSSGASSGVHFLSRRVLAVSE